jgi:hypothetical protein
MVSTAPPAKFREIFDAPPLHTRRCSPAPRNLSPISLRRCAPAASDFQPIP